MLAYISVGADVLASFALVISVFFLLKELRLTRDTMSHADFVSSINRSAENMLRITENDDLLSTIEKISVYRNQHKRDKRHLRRILDGLTPQERVRYFHFQRHACWNCETPGPRGDQPQRGPGADGDAVWAVPQPRFHADSDPGQAML